MKYFIRLDDGSIDRTTEARYAADLCKTTITPSGIGPIHHLDGKKLCAWLNSGRCRNVIATFDTIGEARKRLHEIHLNEALENSYRHNISPLFDTLEAAAEYIIFGSTTDYSNAMEFDDFKKSVVNNLEDCDFVIEYFLAQANERYALCIKKIVLAAGATSAQFTQAQNIYKAKQKLRIEKRLQRRQRLHRNDLELFKPPIVAKPIADEYLFAHK